MRVALYAHAEPDLAGLAAEAARRGWEVALECTDPVAGPVGPRPGLARLVQAVRARAVQGILIRTLTHLARSLRQLTDLGQILAAHDVALIAIEDRLDTTDPGGALRWRDWLEIAAPFTRDHRAQAAKRAYLSTAGERWGRPPVAVNPLELVTFWEGRGGRRPLSQREIAARLGISQATTRKHLQALRDAGQLDDQARTRALAARGGLRRGGRPAPPLDDTVLIATWKRRLQTARLRGTAPSLSAIARTLHISRRRVRTRLQELGLLSQEKSSAQ
ncbi:MAG TPA: recombinase family protein [Thermoanaerobaculia bacterium]